WLEPGMKNVTLEVTDDDGNTSVALFQVQVLNQRPVAVFARPQDGDVDTIYTFVSESFDPDGDTALLQTKWEISDFDDPVYNVSSVSHTFLEPGLYTISLTIVDDRGLSSATKSYSIRIANPLPVPELEFSCPSVNGSVMSEIPQTEDGVVWQVPHTAGGGAFVAPGDPIRFDGSDSYDADPLFVGRTSTDSDSPEWNGIVSWIWDFGDASSLVSGPMVWHAYEIPGIYVVTLTVVDGFEGGETNTTTLTVHVSRAPVILTDDPISADYVAMGGIVLLNSSAEDADLLDGIEAWMDLDQSDDSDGDGNPANDRDRPLTGPLTVRWDLNALQDTDLDGDTRNDWLWGNQTWNQPGEIRILMQVCDGVDVCSSEEYVITVLSVQEDDKPKSLADLTWSDLVPNKESAGLLALVAAVLVLGWLIMREKDEDELDAGEMLETYDVTEVEVEGGLPGMDQHKPPPQPKYLTVQERRNKESGYIRPIRTRRR
ncbi:MAG: PKD domain-containing protein, partial [Candidatus Poseidoniia archaeon]